MALEFVSSAFLSPFMGVLFDRLSSQEFINLFRGKTPIDKQLDELNILLLSADKLLDDAEAKLIGDPKVKNWLDELKDVIYVAGELIDKVDNEALQRKLEGESETGMSKVLSKLIPSSFNAFDNTVRSEMQEILRRLKFLMDQRDVLGLKKTREKKHLNRLPPPLVEESDVFGRDSVKQAIVESLLSDDAGGSNVSVIPVVGIGGIGKTTLAQLVYDEPKVKEHFDKLRVWVTVSADFDHFRITKTIFEKVTSQNCSTLDLQEVRFQLKEALAGKKFLLVLDDVWNQSYAEWDVLRSSLMSGMRGSKIIVTTRSEAVASIMAPQQPHYLSELSEEDCWRVFTKHAFNINENLEEYSDLQEIGRKIVKKCKGHPLAVKSLAGVLHSERSLRKWKEILNSNTWKLNGNGSNDVLPALWLSYYYLPSYLKRCFAYCSVFPKDHLFERKEMILLWMAEGFLQPETARNKVEDVGEQFFEDLISRSLLQRSKLYKSCCVMHDLVHDLAMHVSGEFCFRLDEDKLLLHDIASKTRHVSCNLKVDDLKKLDGVSKAERLHTFIQFEAIESWEEPADYLKLLTTIGCLRVLSLCGFHIKELPDSVGNLKNLRYLKLNYTAVVKLPDSICSLYNLQSLISRECRNLAQFPVNIGRLINLRHLDVYGCSKLRSICWPHEMDQFHGSIINLKQLIYLNISWTNIAKLPDSICSLYNLETLVVSSCSDFTRLPANMGSLINLHHLDTSSSALEEMPLQMGNLKDLETLSDFVLSNYGGSNIKELGELQQLQGTLRISGLENVGDVEDAGKANLKDKKKLNVLALEWKGNADDSIKERDLLQALQPPTNLREIIISGYGGTSFPPWFGSCSFSKMVSMELSSCQNCCSLPPLGKLPFLKELRIHAFHAVETIGDEFYGCDSPFRSLEMLSFKNMPEWNKWSFVEGNKDGAFPRLETLDLINCPKLSGGLPISSHTIETLTIEKCGKLEIPVSHHVYVLLRELTIESSQSIKFFPLEYAPKLNNLDLSDCESFESLTFQEEPLPVLQFLHEMWISGLPKLVSFPKGGLPAPNLKFLSISRCENLRSLPEQMHVLLPTLESLHVNDCPEIKSFPEGGLPSNLKTLEIGGCENLRSLPEQMHVLLPTLESLIVSYCPEIKSFPEGGLPSNLKALLIGGCENLRSLPEQMHVLLPTLESLIVNDCPELKSFPEGGLPSNLKTLEIGGCKNLRSLPEQMHVLLPTLESLSVNDCPEIKSFPEGGLPSNLKTLQIGGCKELVSRYVHWDLRRLTSLISITVGGCIDVLDSFPPDGWLPSSVTSFSIFDFPHLKALNSDAFQRLTELRIYYCPELQCLPEESLLNSLESLNILECPLLEQQYRKEKGEGWPKISHIPEVWIGGKTTRAYKSDKQ